MKAGDHKSGTALRDWMMRQKDGFFKHLRNPANDELNGYSVKLDLL